MSTDTITAPNGQRPAAPPATPRPAGKPKRARKNAKAVQVEARHAAAVLAVLHGEGTQPPEAIGATITAMVDVLTDDHQATVRGYRKGFPSLMAAVEMHRADDVDGLRAAMVGTGW